MRHFLRGEQWQSCLTWCPIIINSKSALVFAPDLYCSGTFLSS